MLSKFCGFPIPQWNNTDGFSLLETVIVFNLVSVLAVMVTGWMLTLRTAEETWLVRTETTAQWESLERVIAVDVHKSLNVNVSATTNLDLTTVNHLKYHYGVNSRGQLVRTQLGGGTAVLCTGLKKVSFILDDGMVIVEGEFTNGSKREAAYDSLVTPPTW